MRKNVSQCVGKLPVFEIMTDHTKNRSWQKKYKTCQRSFSNVLGCYTPSYNADISCILLRLPLYSPSVSLIHVFNCHCCCCSLLVEKIKSTIKELQVGISNMEMEKKHMEGTNTFYFINYYQLNCHHH